MVVGHRGSILPMPCRGVEYAFFQRNEEHYLPCNDSSGGKGDLGKGDGSLCKRMKVRGQGKLQLHNPGCDYIGREHRSGMYNKCVAVELAPQRPASLATTHSHECCDQLSVGSKATSDVFWLTKSRSCIHPLHHHYSAIR